jgi:threonine synthase
VFSLLARLDCTKCGASSERGGGANLCGQCGGPLFARYEVGSLDRDSGASRPRTIWRWHEMMPVEDPANIVSLGEGGAPLLRAERLGAPAGFSDLWIKDEGGNPTGSFKARGLSAAISRAKVGTISRNSL